MPRILVINGFVNTSHLLLLMWKKLTQYLESVTYILNIVWYYKSMSDPSLGSERNLADHSTHLTASLDPLQMTAGNAAPSTTVTGVKLGQTGNIRTPRRVTKVTSDASRPHLLM